MADRAIDPERQAHRAFAVAAFNQVWGFLDKPDRTPDDEAAMVHAAHASRYHWGIVGEPVNWARGDWQISRVYCVLKNADAALLYARSCLALCEKHGIGDFDIAFAYEALARSHACAGNTAEAHRFLAKAREAGNAIKEKEDRDLFFENLATVQGFNP